jgi:hypothetical protein
MKRSLFSFVFFSFLNGLSVFGQFYTPETRFHDVVQSRYIVELARALAWKENLSQPKVAEVTYSLKNEINENTWEIKWLDKTGGVVRQFKVTYDDALLLKGSGFYREIYKQMAGNIQGKSEFSAEKAIQLYWEGADKMGYSRADSLKAALALIPENAKSPATELFPQLAGLLTHAALVSLSGRITLDGVLLARGAAWLAISESMVNDKTGKEGLDALWSPILFLAGRERAGMEAWKKPTSKQNIPADCWDYWFKQPKIEDAFVYAAKPENRRFMLPIVCWYCRCFKIDAEQTIDFDFQNLLPQMYPPEEAAKLFHDYYPFFIIYGGTVTIGHTFSEIGPIFARQSWIDCLRKIEPTEDDFSGYKEELQKQGARLKTELKDVAAKKQDMSLLGFSGAAALIEMGHREGVGKLIPVCVATSRDLLNFGWEATGLHMGARWKFVEGKWGVHELSKSIKDSVCLKVSGLDLFFIETGPEMGAQQMATADRTLYLGPILGLIVHNKEWWKNNVVHDFEEYSSRSWLNADCIRSQISSFYHAMYPKRIMPYIESIRAEGGPLTDSAILQWFAFDLRSDAVPKVPGSKEYKLKFAHEQKQPTHVTITILWDDYKKLEVFERGKQLEQLYWQGVWSDLSSEIVEDYIKAHAYQSAKRFYTQIEHSIESVTFSNGLGPRRFTLAMLENDESAMTEALQASATGSAGDMVMNIAAAAWKDDMKSLEEQVDEYLARYDGHDKMMLSMKGFVPLVPALKDSKQPDHNKALDYFAKNDEWPTLQWILIKNSKLSTEEAVRFLGGRETDWQRQFIVLYLLKDKVNFEAKYQEQEKIGRSRRRYWGNMAFILIHNLRNELLEIPIPKDQPDLRPTDYKTLTERVLTSLQK